MLSALCNAVKTKVLGSKRMLKGNNTNTSAIIKMTLGLFDALSSSLFRDNCP